MKPCSNCRKTLPTDIAFCPYCGTQTAQQPPAAAPPRQRRNGVGGLLLLALLIGVGALGGGALLVRARASASPTPVVVALEPSATPIPAPPSATPTLSPSPAVAPSRTKPPTPEPTGTRSPPRATRRPALTPTAPPPPSPTPAGGYPTPAPAEPTPYPAAPSTFPLAADRPLPPGEPYGDFRSVSDDTGQLTLTIPATWGETDGSVWTRDDAEEGIGLSASPDIKAFRESWTVPGIFLGASRTLIEQGMTEESLLDEQDFSDSCTYAGREPYTGARYSGFYDLWAKCDGSETLFIAVAMVPEDRAFLVLLQAQVISLADLAALDRALAETVVAADLESDTDGSTGISVSAMDVGDCFNLDEDAGDTAVTACTEPHDYEIFATFDHPAGPDAPFPGDDELDEFWDDPCTGAFAKFVGLPYDESALYMSALEPTASSWAAGDREVLCALYEQGTQLTGSMRGARR